MLRAVPDFICPEQLPPEAALHLHTAHQEICSKTSIHPAIRA